MNMNEQDKATPPEKSALDASSGAYGVDWKNASPSVTTTPFEREALSLRRRLKSIAVEVQDLKRDVTRGLHLPNTETGRTLHELEDRGEMLANLSLAYRHLEDASMRLGKAIQASNGGTSVYDRESTVGA